MPNKRTPLVSVVIPAYNVADYLDECLESVVAQTYASLEIILVDDGSTDDTGERCDSWAVKDARVHVVHQSNGGLSAARNTGISLAQGEYLLIIDSDDRISRELVQRCVMQLEDNSADFVHFGYRTISATGDSVKKHPNPDADSHELLLLVLSNRVESHSWQFLCRRSLYDGISFPEGRKAEDVATTYKLVARANRCVLIPDCLYEYRIREGSILADAGTDSTKAVRYYEDELCSFHEMVSWALATNREEYIKASRNSMIEHLFCHYEQMLAANSIDGLDWVSHRLDEEFRSIDLHSLDSFNRVRAMLFKIGVLGPCYRLKISAKSFVKRLLGIK